MYLRVLGGLILFQMLGINSDAQESRFRYSINSGLIYNQIKTTVRVSSVADFGILKNSGEYKVGVVSQLWTDNAESLSDAVKLSGVHLGYSKILPTPKAWLNLELKSDVIFQRFKSAWTSNSWDQGSGKYLIHESISNENLITASIGYGLKITVSKHFYLGQSFDGGFYFSGIKGNSSSLAVQNFDFRRYKNFGLQWSGQFTIGYAFILKKLGD
jgi:hypothetical protein